MRKKTHDEFVKEVFDLVGDEYTFLEQYITSSKNIKVIHNTCGYEYTVTPSNFINGGIRCKECKRIEITKKQTRPFEDVLKKIDEDGFEFIECPDGYKNDKSKIIIKCQNGHLSTKSVVSLIHYGGCPSCKVSKGENKIREFLISNNVNFSEQYRFEDCKNKKPLPFDFAVFDKDNKLSFLIEYDGEQHYIPYRTENGQKKLEYIQSNDKIKSDYCKNSNISLIRIPYWDFKNIETIIKIALKEVRKE